MKQIKNIIAITFLTLLLITSANAQTSLENVKIKTNIFEIEYSQRFQQPLVIKYKVQCPTGDEERDGMVFKKYPGVITSDDDDYANNDDDNVDRLIIIILSRALPYTATEGSV